MTDGVSLKTVSNENINEKISELLIQLKTIEERKESIAAGKKCTFEDLPSLKIGNVGETTTLILLGYLVPNEAYLMCPVNDDAINHIHNIMPQMVMSSMNTQKLMIFLGKHSISSILRSRLWTM